MAQKWHYITQDRVNEYLTHELANNSEGIIMKLTKAPFSKMALALLLSVSGMLLSLSALAIATGHVNHELHTIEVDDKITEIKGPALLVQRP